VRGGKKPYSYKWSNDSTTEDITGLSPGIYSVNVSDANDSTATDSIYISEPELLIAEIKDSSNTSYYGYSDGMADVKVTGGTLPYFYQWDDSAMTSGPIVTDLKANTIYRVSVTDKNGCTSSDSVMIINSDILFVEISVMDELLCPGDTNGTAIAIPYHAELPVEYLWNDPANTIDSIVTNLSPNRYYSILVTDAIGNTGYDSIMLNEPDEIHIDSIFIKNVHTCFGYSNGSISVIANMGSESLQYSIDNGETYQEDWSFFNLPAGEYNMIIKDTNNCLFVLDSLIIHQPAKVQTGIIIGDDQVNENDITFYSTTAKPGSTYEWFISGGNLKYGQGSNFINVQWDSKGIGKISVIETDTHGCVGDTVRKNVLINILGINDLNNNSGKYLVFPNPSQNYIVITSSDNNIPHRIELVEIYGRVVRNVYPVDSFPVKISIDKVRAGLYFLIIYSEDIHLLKVII
jgi:hypothetical protein